MCPIANRQSVEEKMAKSSSITLLSLSLLLHLFFAKSEIPLAPALYVFGDSLEDSGNNNLLNTAAKANYNPYGIDFPGGATGRFTNGKTSSDFTGQSLGLPFIPPYLGLSEDERRRTITGLNYASGSAGILTETGTALGTNLGMEKQVQLFEETVRTYLPGNFKSPKELCLYLSKSIFMVSIGSNDYINNYLQPENYNTSLTYTPEKFAVYLLDQLKLRLTKLYNLGARKFVVFEIGPLGCIPVIVNTLKPTTRCAEEINQLVLLYNSGLPGVLEQLTFTLQGSIFVFGDFYSLSYDINQNPSSYGFNGTIAPCCIVGDTGLCIKDQAPCQDRTARFYWDLFHPMQEVNNIVAKRCFSNSSPCTPINILQLALLPPAVSSVVRCVTM
ncbi:hypothetical protein HHK36_032032 [Tetracentron sinense]|uniref:Uncharacterized protein n=1 Tax=Tetracentron sinense TaxID=13715 RepID=A0A834Y7Z3_TETSI|nr:hypothetical protein HHK36_032032 [Tetracentron sinense]